MYQTGSATDLADLVTKLFTFATANGWTSDQLSTGTGQAAFHRGNVYISFRWNTTTPLHMGLYQALGYTGGNQPGQHPNDSGDGAVSSTNSSLLNERCVSEIGNGPFPSYYFFDSDTYLHVVVETSTDVFRHFGFGELTKFGDWTGGEYCYGHMRASSGTPITSTHCVGLDALFSDGSLRERCATVHLEGLPGMAGASKWGCVGNFTTAPVNDPAGNARVLVRGGLRGGLIGRQFGIVPAGSASGLQPMYPIGLFYRNLANSNCYWLGWQTDVRGCNVRFHAPKAEVTIGSDVWVFFPMTKRTTAAETEASQYAGIAYKKVTT